LKSNGKSRRSWPSLETLQIRIFYQAISSPVADTNGVAAEVEIASGDSSVNSFEAAINNKLDYVVKALDDFKLHTIFQEENKKLKESLNDISNKHNNLLCVVSDLNTQIKL
jgi:hypothetical protein